VSESDRRSARLGAAGPAVPEHVGAVTGHAAGAGVPAEQLVDQQRDLDAQLQGGYQDHQLGPLRGQSWCQG